ncbi:MAG: associated Golgi protein [Fibrobacteria bacterium]|jgi:membrane-associated protein|nr:associated Golgi protein [Fibrobacteria bacterium]
MEFIQAVLDFFLHFDAHLAQAIQQYGALTYLILFVIIFCETGLVVTPFLPGDSLLFAVGSFAALGLLNPFLAFFLLVAAAILGDAVNYGTGRIFGMKGFSDTGRFLNTRYIDKTTEFYAKHGAKTLVLARFLPIVRTFAPFVAGMGGMAYGRFTSYNISGAVLWVFSCMLAGYLFGNIPVIQDNFSLVVLGIIVVSLLPTLFAVARSRFGNKGKNPA